jgi:hypothetical protein
MARRNHEPTLGADKAKVRVFFAEVEGNNDSVQEALKTMVSAMSRPVRVISEQKANGGAAALLQQADAEAGEEAVDPAEEIEAPDEESTNSRRIRGSGKKVDRNAGINLVPNLEFRPDGRQTLKEFVAAKNPKSDLESCLSDRLLHAAPDEVNQDRPRSCHDRFQGSWKSNSCGPQADHPEHQKVKDVVELH